MDVKRAIAAIAAVICTACVSAPRPAAVAAPSTFSIPVEYYTLPNGLRVVLSPSHVAPRVTVAVHYGVGDRVEPKNRTGFAHLFEHLMFQGSRNLGKMEFMKLVRSNGGVAGGSTHRDFTEYHEIIPSNMLRTVLWAEGDRMKGLSITEENLTTQKSVVVAEIAEWVGNRAYGGFPWLDMPQAANVNWYNAHNFYGDLADIEAATLGDASSFFKTYYAPNNAALVINGDFDRSQAMAWITEYFGGIPSQPQPPKADVSEPRQEREKRASKSDPKATRPAIAIAYHEPPPETDAYYALALIHQILASGRDGWLYEDLVLKRGLTGDVDATLNFFDSMFDVQGPMLYTISLYHDADKTDDEIVKAIDEDVDRLRRQPVDAATLERVRVKARAAFYKDLDRSYGFGRADLLAVFALFYGDPARINRVESRLAAVTPELIRETAEEYLRPENRTILTIVPKSAGTK